MKLEYFILGILTINPMTGYDIKKYLDTEGRFGRKRAPLSQIYNTLKRMVDNGWVTFEEEVREGKPDIKIYHNTEVGQETLLDYLHSPIEPSFRYRESDIFYRIMFAFLVESQVIIAQIQAELDFRKEQIAKFRPRDRTIHSENLSEDQLAYTQEIYEMLHSFGARGIDDYVRSLEETLEFFNQQIGEQE